MQDSCTFSPGQLQSCGENKLGFNLCGELSRVASGVLSLLTFSWFIPQDTNPIFLFSKSSIESATPPSASINYGSGERRALSVRPSVCPSFQCVFSVCLSLPLTMALLSGNFSVPFSCSLPRSAERRTNRTFHQCRVGHHCLCTQKCGGESKDACARDAIEPESLRACALLRCVSHGSHLVGRLYFQKMMKSNFGAPILGAVAAVCVRFELL